MIAKAREYLADYRARIEDDKDGSDEAKQGV